MSFIDWAANKVGMVTADELTRKLDAVATEQKESTTLTLESLFLSGKEIIYGSAEGIESAYDSGWTAYSCMKRLGTDASGVPLKFLRDPQDLESDLPESHPTVQLFKNPNPYFTTSEFIQWIVTLLQLRGEFFIMFDDPIMPRMMYQFTEPMSWKPKMDGADVAMWEYRRGREHHVEAPENIIHHRFIDPTNPHRGQPPLRAAAKAHNIDIGADTLQQDIVARGGERSVMYEAPTGTTRRQREQASETLKGRRAHRNRVARDVVLPTGLKVIDPKFLEDDLKILESQKMQPDKICAVYGLSKSLLGIEDIDKYATFQGRIKAYFHQTLKPQLKGIEDAFDKFFVETARPSDACYVRFDYSNVTALQEDAGEQFKIAGEAHKNGLPWLVLNDRFNLGLDLAMVPGNETVLVSSALAPIERLIKEWSETPAVAPSSAGQSGGAAGGVVRSLADGPALTNGLIEKRARDPRIYLQRQMRMFKLEKAFRLEWKRIIQSALNKTGITPESIEKQRGPTKKAVAAFTRGAHEHAALEGEASIIELVEGKMSDQLREVFKGKHKWRPEVDAWFDRRENLIADDVIDDLFDDVKQATIKSIKDGDGVQGIQRVIKGRFESAPGGINRAITIARTELGSAFNFARHEEMKGQGFKKHKWLTAGDEKVRDDPFNHAGSDGQIRAIGDGEKFACGLEYPMQEGGKAGNVINCRCETIPSLEV